MNRTTKIIAGSAGGLVLLLAGVGIGGAGRSPAHPSPAQTVTVYQTQPAPDPVTVTVTPTANAQGLSTVISSDGVYVIGQDIPGGTWHTSGGGDCYEATLSGLDTSNVDDIISNNNFKGPDTVNLAGAKAFEINGGCTWRKG